MNYPEEFKDAVRAVYPGNKKVADMLNEGQNILGRFLNDSIKGAEDDSERKVLANVYKQWTNLSKNQL